MRLITVFTIILFFGKIGFAQDSSHLDKAIAFPDKLFSALDKKTILIEQKLDKHTHKYLSRIEKQELKLQKKIWKKDSLLAKEMFDGISEKYNHLKNISGKVNKYQNVYSGHLDSLATTLNFLKDNKLAGNTTLDKTLNRYKEFQLKLNASDQVKKYLVERREQLKRQFEKLGMTKQLKKLRKDIFYYQAQIKEYKQMFEDPSKVEERLMSVIQKLPQFKDFFAKNSMLGSLFPLPGNSNSTLTANVIGLQTRATITQAMTNSFGASFNMAERLQQNSGSAQGQLNGLKNKLSSYTSGSYGNGDADFPSKAIINSQKTKSFFNRIEVGTNIQTKSARYMFPITSDIGLSFNYKINDQAFAGIGLTGSVGWGTGWSNLKVSYQGIGARSNLDWKLKGSMYITGGYEMNYRNLIRSMEQLRDYSTWQVSGLLGLSKRYQVSKKVKGEVKLLWDFMSYQQVPRNQPVLFRVGYSLK